MHFAVRDDVGRRGGGHSSTAPRTTTTTRRLPRRPLKPFVAATARPRRAAPPRPHDRRHRLRRSRRPRSMRCTRAAEQARSARPRTPASAWRAALRCSAACAPLLEVIRLSDGVPRHDIHTRSRRSRTSRTQLRIDSIRSTSGSGQRSSDTCMSAAEIVATLFFAEMRYDPQDPRNPYNDRFVLSKGHAAPILYAAWAEAGLFPREELLKLRQIGSDLEGHPTPRLSFVDVATGSLGQGICAAIGIALNARRIGSDYRTYVLLGDGEMAEGSVWEAANAAVLSQARQPVRHHRRQRARPEPADPVRPRHGRNRRPLEGLRLARVIVDGHDVQALLDAYGEARADEGPADGHSGPHVEGQGRVARSRARTAGTARRSRKGRKPTRQSPSSRRR